MFEKINGPTDQYSGPATGLTTEKGDNWHTAVKKINDGFSNIVKFLEGGGASIESEAATGWEKIAHDLAEAMALLQLKHDALEARVKAMGTMSPLPSITDPAHSMTIAPAPTTPAPEPQTASFGTAGILGGALTAKPEEKSEPDSKPATEGTPIPGGAVTTTGPVSATSHD